ncbi:MAG: glycine zipper 2TM domain-containing protein [Pseudomonadota bacterium]|nr:glycine zipper 2TM domain-containing protein [Pseudomonadota bacterium]
MNLRLLGVAAASALALAGCVTPGYGTAGSGYGSSGYSNAPARCFDCGVITRIEPIQTGTAPRATGAVLGGLVGAAAGRELADDESTGRRNTATVAGAAAGAVAGNAIQQGISTQYNVYVRMDDGRSSVVTLNSMGSLRVGSPVRVNNGRLMAR